MNDENFELPEEETSVIAEEQKNLASRWAAFWDNLVELGIAERAQRVGTAVLLVVLILLIVWVMGRYYLPEQVPNLTSATEEIVGVTPEQFEDTAEEDEPAVSVELPPLVEPYSYEAYDGGVSRLAKLHTDLPTRPRWDITTYTVQEGDTITGIGEKFNLHAETVMWANYYVLADNPHSLSPGQVLNILPVDGTYYEWHAGDGLSGVAEFFGVTPEAIVEWPGNELTEETVGDYANPNIEPGTWLVIPGGERDYISWSAPLITRESAAQASIFGPGACGAVYDGPIGDGVMIWPTIERWLSGYDYSPETNHYGIDIAGDLGYAIWSVDDGVIVYSGWNDWGYGNVVVVDHGNGWQSLYAHLDYINYGCGDYVYEGDILGGMGSTGRSSGPHLHFELRSSTYGRPNPKDFLN